MRIRDKILLVVIILLPVYPIYFQFSHPSLTQTEILFRIWWYVVPELIISIFLIKKIYK
jgi:hypothetical protein